MVDKNGNKFEYGDIVWYEGAMYNTFSPYRLVADEKTYFTLIISFDKKTSSIKHIEEIEVVDREQYPEVYL